MASVHGIGPQQAATLKRALQQGLPGVLRQPGRPCGDQVLFHAARVMGYEVEVWREEESRHPLECNPLRAMEERRVAQPLVAGVRGWAELVVVALDRVELVPGSEEEQVVRAGLEGGALVALVHADGRLRIVRGNKP